MKATITYEGVRIETDATAAEVQELVFALKDGPLKKTKRGRPSNTTDVVQLTAVQGETWQWLVANDTEHGRHPSDLVKDNPGMTHPVAENRLKRLVDLGLATKVSPARYRVVKTDEQ